MFIVIVIVFILKSAMIAEQNGSGAPEKKSGEKTPFRVNESDALAGKVESTRRELDTLREQAQRKQRPDPLEIRALHKQHRADEWERNEQHRADEWERNEQRHADERAHSERRWELARKKQADRSEVHSVHMDSCADRLESLKILYEAGILDREEYAQRVARVKKAHAQSRD